jgi:ethanolaminephosphotransferase
VDNTVTDAAIPAMKNSGWDTIIMHYLGIDHIGHLDGAHRYYMHFISASMFLVH